MSELSELLSASNTQGLSARSIARAARTSGTRLITTPRPGICGVITADPTSQPWLRCRAS